MGSKVVQAGLVGAVRWAAPEAKALAGSTPFKLQVSVVYWIYASHGKTKFGPACVQLFCCQPAVSRLLLRLWSMLKLQFRVLIPCASLF